MKNRRIFVLAGIAIVIAIFTVSSLMFHRANSLAQNCVFDILTPREMVEIFFDVVETALNKPEVKILPHLSSSTRNFLRADNIYMHRGESFSVLNSRAGIQYHHSYTMLGEPISRISFHNPPFQGEDTKQRYKYMLLEGALIKSLGEPQMRGWTYSHNLEVSFWRIDNGIIYLSISRNYRASAIIMAFSTEIREPVLFSFY